MNIFQKFYHKCFNIQYALVKLYYYDKYDIVRVKRAGNLFYNSDWFVADEYGVHSNKEIVVVPITFEWPKQIYSEFIHVSESESIQIALQKIKRWLFDSDIEIHSLLTSDDRITIYMYSEEDIMQFRLKWL